jgi:hypothetical protein
MHLAVDHDYNHLFYDNTGARYIYKNMIKSEYSHINELKFSVNIEVTIKNNREISKSQCYYEKTGLNDYSYIKHLRSLIDDDKLEPKDLLKIAKLERRFDYNSMHKKQIMNMGLIKDYTGSSVYIHESEKS